MMNCLYIVIGLFVLSSCANQSPISQTPNQQPPASAQIPISLGHMKVLDPSTPEAKALIKSFRIPPSVALKIAEHEYDRRLKLRNIDDGGIMDKTPIAIVGRYYLFGKPYKAKLRLRGYLVDSASGAVEWVDWGEYAAREQCKKVLATARLSSPNSDEYR
jgi:hypothetical protein